ncbi:MAG: SBBP repeat-containing protein, partial [Rhodothermales bacterium]
NYFIGRDRSKWRTGVPHYARIRYEGVYPGIDLVFYGTNQRQLEYDFTVQPGADPARIRLAIEGAKRLEIARSGDLIAHLASGEVRFKKPVIYQEANGKRRSIKGKYTLAEGNRIGFEVGPYDASHPLIIDPMLTYSTYLGGTGSERGDAITVDSAGNAYVVGATDSIDFPTTEGAFDEYCGTDGGCNPEPYLNSDAFVTKLSADGSALVYSTYLGGADGDGAAGIAVDGLGNAYVTGSTASADFPRTKNAFQQTFGGGDDAFVTKLSANGSALFYSTYLGGASDDYGEDIAVDASGNAYVTGLTLSSNFPTTDGAFATSHNGGFIDAFVAKIDPSTDTLVYSTYLGGTGIDFGFGIAVDSGGNAYVTGFTDDPNGDFPTTENAFQRTFGGGYDAFVTKLNPIGNLSDFCLNQSGAEVVCTDPGRVFESFPYSTYLGGSSNDESWGIAVDSLGNAYVTGWSTSTDFPTTENAFQKTIGGKNGREPDAIVAKLNAAGSALVYSTYLGGKQLDYGFGIAIDGDGNAYVTGYTQSRDFPTAGNAFQPAYGGGGSDAFVTKLNVTGNALVYSSYLGGSDSDSGEGIAAAGGGNAYVVGYSYSSDFPTTGDSYQPLLRGTSDAFVVKVSDAVAPSPPEEPGGGGGKGKPCNQKKEAC